MLSLETLDLREGLAASKKAYPLTTKYMKTSQQQQQSTEKPSKGSSAGLKKTTTSGKGTTKNDKVKALLHNYEAIFDQKSPKYKDLSRLGLDVKDTSKTYLIDELPKKASLPNNLALNLNTIYHATGSTSHRAPINSPPEHHLSGLEPKKVATDVTRKKNPLETEYQILNSPLTSPPAFNNSNAIPSGQRGYSFNNLFIDLATISHDPLKNISKISINNINNINTINNSRSTVEDRLGTSQDGGNNGQAELIAALNMRNEEVQQLTREKAELKGILQALVYEINDLKRAKAVTKGKEDTLDGLKQSIVNILGTSEYDREDLLKESVSSGSKNSRHPPLKLTQNQPQKKKRSGSNVGISEISIKNSGFHTHKTVLTDSSDDLIGRGGQDHKDSLLEALTKKGQKLKNKGSYFAFNSQEELVKGSKTASQQSSTHLNTHNSSYQRTTGDDHYHQNTGKKVKESPYYEILKEPIKKKNGILGTKRSTGNINGGHEGIKKESTRSLRSKDGSSKGDLYIETSGRMLEIDDEYDRNMMMRQVPKTTTNADLEMLRRKFSTDTENIVVDLFGKKQSLEACGFHKMTKKEENLKESLDIGRALGGLKDRVSRLLGRFQEDRELLKDMQGKMVKLGSAAAGKK